MTFAQRLHARILERDTRLCLGLDPRPEMHPSTMRALHNGDSRAMALAVEQHCLDVLSACEPSIAAVKPNLAYFEALGTPGLGVLEKICVAARGLDLPIILDAKRGDFPESAKAYATAWLTGAHAGDALTVNPFLGFETLTPFLSTANANGGAIFALVKTSNSGSADLQDLVTPQGTVSEIVARHLEDLTGAAYGAVGAVVGATHTAQLAGFRALMPHVVLLLPGLGAQGAQAKDLAPAFDADGLGALATSSRAIHYASQGTDYAVKARAVAQTMRDELNTALRQRLRP
jgi:orotidine-5'-phosphate decarboxylase